MIFLGRWDSLYDFCFNYKFNLAENTVVTTQLFLFILGITISVIIVPVQLAKTKNKLEKKEKQYIELLAYSKDKLIDEMKKAVRKESSTLNTRIFVPTNDLISKTERLLKVKKKLAVKHIDGISDSLNANKLYFEVYPEVQGLVGMTYNNKIGMIDCEVQSLYYNLTPYQTGKTGNVKFCSTFPILDEKSNVKGVLSIDSDNTITFTKDEYKTWTDQIRYYCAFIDKYVKI